MSSVIFFPLQIKLLLCIRNNLKNWMPLQCLTKVLNETEESKSYVQPYKKMEKVLCFAIVSIQ